MIGTGYRLPRPRSPGTGGRHRGRGSLIGLLAAAGSLGLALPGAASAAVTFEPTPAPTTTPPQHGGRVELAWAGVAITFPDAWEVRFKRPPDRAVTGGAPVLVALGPASAICTLDLFDPDSVEQWEDVGIEPVAELTIGGIPAARYDDMWGGGAIGVSSYAVFATEIQYSLLCKADVAPDDRWLSIADTIEVFPATAIAFVPQDR